MRRCSGRPRSTPTGEGATLSLRSAARPKKTNSSREPFTSLAREIRNQIINSSHKWRAIKIDLGSHNKNTCNQSRADADPRSLRPRLRRTLDTPCPGTARHGEKEIRQEKRHPTSAAHFSEPIFSFVWLRCSHAAHDLMSVGQINIKHFKRTYTREVMPWRCGFPLSLCIIFINILLWLISFSAANWQLDFSRRRKMHDLFNYENAASGWIIFLTETAGCLMLPPLTLRVRIPCVWYYAADGAEISERCKTVDCVTFISRALNPVFYLYNNNKTHEVYTPLQLTFRGS